MGNSDSTQKKKKKSWLKRSDTYSNSDGKHAKQQAAAFFIDHCQKNSQRDAGLILSELDGRRVVFISLVGLYVTWNDCPCYLLQSAVFVLPLHKQWLYDPDSHVDDICARLGADSLLLADQPMTAEFIQLLKWKDSQDLLFFTLDDFDSHEEEMKRDNTDRQDAEHSGSAGLVAPFWYAFNNKLIRLHDPVSGQCYEPVSTDCKYWSSILRKEKPSANVVSLITSAQVMSELYFVQMHFKTFTFMLDYSNAGSLHVVTSFIAAQRQTSRFVCSAGDDQEFDDDDNGSDWCMSPDYDPYEGANDSFISPQTPDE